MGALTGSRKRGHRNFTMSHSHPRPFSSKSDYRVENVHSTKRPRLCFPQPKSSVLASSVSAISRLYLYPEQLPQLKREVHAPCRFHRFGILSNSLESSRPRVGTVREEKGFVDYTGNILHYKYNLAKRHAVEHMKAEEDEELMCVQDETVEKEKEVIDLDEYSSTVGSEDSSIEVANAEVGVQEGEDLSVVSVGSPQENDYSAEIKSEPDLIATNGELTKETENVDNAEKMLHMLSLKPNTYELSIPLFEKLRWSALRRDTRLNELKFQIELNESRRSLFHQTCLTKKATKDVKLEAFVPLTKDEEEEVSKAFCAKRNRVLVTHENSNITITAEIFQCLRPRAWLNDEVINLYLELLKEREKREPKDFLKCHFFNTFFYKKLISGRSGYDFKSVRRWTTSRRLGYNLLECDKIFVPIHKEIHWCLAVINKKDAKFQYLDSLRGKDMQVLEVLARYIVDEAKDKGGEDINVSDWKKQFVDDFPEQKNGFDCGMFIVKFADFYSRGWDLSFKQDDMPYFRMRTAKEILRLRAE